MKNFTRILNCISEIINIEIKPKGCGNMTHKKVPNNQKMDHYKKEKLEVAEELGINGCNNTEVNVEVASQGEPKFSNKTMTKHRNLKNDQKNAKE